MAQSSQVSDEIMSIADMPLKPQVYQVGDRYLILYRGTVTAQNKPLGKVYTRLPQAGIQVTSDGNGLGLAIVKTLVEGMGGSISVRSKLGEGSEFTIVLPT